MDIVKELIQIQSKEKTFSELIKQLETERNKIDKIKTNSLGKIINDHDAEEREMDQYNKKIHIFKILEFKELFDHFYTDGSLEKHNINKVELYYANLMTEKKFNILFWSDDQFIKKTDMNGKIIESINQLQNLASRLKDFSIDNLHENFKQYDTLTGNVLLLDLNDNTSINIQNLLLSDELQVVLNSNIDYLSLRKDFSNENINKSKKTKI